MSTSWEELLAVAGARSDGLGVAAALRLARAPWALRAMRCIAPYNPRWRGPARPAAAFALDLVRRVFASHPERVIWCNVLTPAELIWGLGLTPFYPEVAVGALASLDLTQPSLAAAAGAGCPTDLCTFHRSAYGAACAGYFPAGAAYVATSHPCTVSGVMLAGDAHRNRRPFTLIDVPPAQDTDALDYVEGQLAALVNRLEAASGVRHDPARLRRAIRLSNQARGEALAMYALRAARPAPVRGSRLGGNLGYLAWMLGHPDGVAYYRAWRREVAARVARAEPEQPVQKLRIYWMHLRPADDSLLAHLEDELGVVIPFEEHSTIWWDALNEDRPLRALAARLLDHPSHGPVERRIRLTLDNVARYDCDAVIHFSHWGCRQTAGSVRVIRDRLRAEGIPFLDLDGDCLDPTNLQLGPLRTRLDAFIETLG